MLAVGVLATPSRARLQTQLPDGQSWCAGAGGGSLRQYLAHGGVGGVSLVISHGNSELCAGLRGSVFPPTKVSRGWEGRASQVWAQPWF